jgi:hypothetical protein
MNHHTLNIHERFLCHIWSKQYLTTALRTTDGKSIKVFDVGQWNSGGGPDFCNAKIKINGTTYSGDIEIHRTVFDWLKHQHQEDPRYNKVILHVVLENSGDVPPTLTDSGRQIPLLVLSCFLSDSLQTVWQKAILDERAKKSETIPCYNKNLHLTSESLDHWFSKLAVERIERKIRRFEQRLQQLAHESRQAIHERRRPYGEPPLEGEHEDIPSLLPEFTQKDYTNIKLWEQVLFEGVMEGLGYSKNQAPFLRLAQTMTLKTFENYGLPISEATIESLLFGVANLLPKSKDLQEKNGRHYVHELRKRWKELRPQYHGEILHGADWQFFPTRPSNFPTIRLAAASLLINEFLEHDLFRRIIQTLKANISDAEKELHVIQFFTVETNDFWKHHYRFEKAASRRVNALGNSRIHEIVMNAVLPIALLYARIFKDVSVREGALKVCHSLPASGNNSIIRFMEKQLLKGRLPLKSMSRQQAVIQLYSFYCTDGRCSECELGVLLTRKVLV